ncbi:MAG: Outer membrane lipoprotein carrier protein LolA [uncultured Sulfurovum sp.]|uniref:Outer membrane lipoprotein carrier protein LolA n=1 Tax=uncultured Sulfurovum sp. TaxID=269237 RepID=A0A6S6T9R7_9BACT|nr:MAG: Outer membrane lipoprotein carrier protein LolA [uncultured Sulfurovum sp.]
MKLLLSLLALSATLSATITLPQNFETSFSQTITNDQGKVINYAGSVLFKSQEQHFLNAMEEETVYSRNLFKWSYTLPSQKEVCTDGTQLIVVDHDLEQVSNYMVDNGINLNEILKIAEKTSSKDYKAFYKDTEYFIQLDAKEQLEEITYVDSLDNKVKIVFTVMQYNTRIEDSSLECKIPDMYDIIKG